MLHAVAEKPFETVRLEDLDEIPVTDTLLWRPVRRRLGVEAFGVNAYTARNAGDEIIEEHDETGSGAGHHEELYFVTSGRVTFTVAGEELDAPAGTFVFVRDPSARRHGVAKEAGSTVLAIGGRRGEGFEVSPWEHYFSAIPHAKQGDFTRAAEVTAEGLARHPDNPSLLYNLACFEAQAGHRSEALEHLRRAFDLDPEKIHSWAAQDSDLDSIRADPAYPVT
jgi:mannose-6-phosphate isomerase-like protein (cupin superfamily)